MYKSSRTHVKKGSKQTPLRSKKIKAVFIKPSVRNILSRNNTYKRRLFRGYCLKGKVHIPSNITKINENAFKDCLKLTEIIIPETVTYIGDNAFDGCKKLTLVTMYESVKFIGKNAFNNCESLKNIIIKKITSNNYCSVIDFEIENICYLESTPEQPTIIENTAFNNCSMLELITLESIDTFRIKGNSKKLENLFKNSPKLKLKIPVSIFNKSDKKSNTLKKIIMNNETNNITFNLSTTSRDYREYHLSLLKNINIFLVSLGQQQKITGVYGLNTKYADTLITESLLTEPQFKNFYPFQIVADKGEFPKNVKKYKDDITSQLLSLHEMV